MVDYKPVSTPMVVGQHLSGNGSPYVDLTHFRSITRPDFALSVYTVCQFMHAPTEDHYQDVKSIHPSLHQRFSSFWLHHLL